MLGPILQAIANQVGPAINQLLQNVSPLLQQIPSGAYYAAGRILSKEVSDWYNSLPPEEKKQLNDAILWIIEDLAGDYISDWSGLPLKPLVNKVFDKVKKYKGNTNAEHYVEGELKRQIELHAKE